MSATLIALPAKNGVLLQLFLHHAQRLLAACKRRGEPLRRRLLGAVGIDQQRAAHRDVGLVAVLLEEQPLIGKAALVAVGRQQARAFGEIEQHGIGFGEQAAVFEFEQRHLAVGILGDEGGRARAPVGPDLVSTWRNGMPSLASSSRGL